MTTDTPATRLLASIAELEQVEDAGVRAEHGHALQETIKAVAPLLRTIVGGAVREQREAGVMLDPVAKRLGVSVQQVSQMGSSRYAAKRKAPPMIYAARIVGDDGAELPGEPWHGAPDALPGGHYGTGSIDFRPAVAAGRFAGRKVELRYGAVSDDGLPPGRPSYIVVNGLRLRPTVALHKVLFAEGQ